jgi:SAM-dependent methyltransferase
VPVENDMRPYIFNNLDEIPEMKFDFITAIEVFEHLPNPAEVLETLVNRLTPDGYLFISTAIINRSLPSLKLFTTWVYQQDPTHIGFFHEHSLEYLAKKHGLDLQIFGYGVFVMDRSGKRAVIFEQEKWGFWLNDNWGLHF